MEIEAEIIVIEGRPDEFNVVSFIGIENGNEPCRITRRKDQWPSEPEAEQSDDRQPKDQFYSPPV